MPEKKKKPTTKKQNTKTVNKEKSKTKRKPGRPPKNVIGKKKKKGSVGRPRKNVIKPKATRTAEAKKKKKPSKKPSSKKKRTAKNKTTTTKQLPTNKQNKTTFMNHKIKKLKKQNNFAVILLIFSFLLFAFSIYKAFFADDSARKMKQSLENIFEEQTITEDTPNITTIEIDSYDEVMGLKNDEENQPTALTTGENNKHSTKTEEEPTNSLIETGSVISIETEADTIQDILPEPENMEKGILPKHTFTRAFDKNEENEEIKTLQKLLYKENFYTGETHGINDEKTRNALYQFQLKYNILTPTDSYSLRGYFGPSTRSKANSLMPK